MLRTGTHGLAALVMVVFGSISAHAQTEPGATQEHLARTFREQGVESARAGNWEGAREQFQRSYDLDPRVLTLYNLAAAEQNSGALVEADEHFRRFIRATQDGTHAQFHAEAIRYRDELTGRIARLTISIANLQPSDRILMNDAELAQAALGVELPVNPGRNRIVVMRDGQVLGEDTRVLADGASERVNMELVAPPVPSSVPTARETAAASPSTEPQVLAEAPTDNRGRNVAIGVVVAVVVVAGLAVGGYFLFRDTAADPYQGTLGTIDFR